MLQTIFEYVLPALGFFFAIVGAWEKLTTFFLFIRKRQVKIKLDKARRDIEKINKYNSDTIYFTAHISKYLFSFISVIFILNLFSSYPDTSINVIYVKAFFFGILSYLAGFIAGNALRVTNYVLQKEKLLAKLNETIEQYQAG
jgi:hypothetical protein